MKIDAKKEIVDARKIFLFYLKNTMLKITHTVHSYIHSFIISFYIHIMVAFTYKFR